MHAILTYKNSKIAYSVFGKGSTIVLLHGFLENRKMWNSVTDVLSEKHRFVCIDLLGHGDSDLLGYVHTIDEQAAVVKAVLDHLRLRRYTILGHSMGGYVALEFAKKHGDNLKGLCLMNSTALADSQEKKKNRERAVTAVRQNHRMFVKLAIPMLFSENNRRFFEAEIKSLTADALNMSPRSIVAALKGMKERKSNIQVFKENRFPILLIAGEKDPVLEYDSLVEQIKNTAVQFVSFSGGHMSHIENSTAFLKTISVFFRYCARK